MNCASKYPCEACSSTPSHPASRAILAPATNCSTTSSIFSAVISLGEPHRVRLTTRASGCVPIRSGTAEGARDGSDGGRPQRQRIDCRPGWFSCRIASGSGGLSERGFEVEGTAGRHAWAHRENARFERSHSAGEDGIAISSGVPRCFASTCTLPVGGKPFRVSPRRRRRITGDEGRTGDDHAPASRRPGLVQRFLELAQPKHLFHGCLRVDSASQRAHVERRKGRLALTSRFGTVRPHASRMGCCIASICLRSILEAMAACEG